MKFTLRNANNPVGRPRGLGTALKAITSSLGVKPCSACQKRAETLDRLTDRRAREGQQERLTQIRSITGTTPRSREGE